jgi:hypothetical protein
MVVETPSLALRSAKDFVDDDWVKVESKPDNDKKAPAMTPTIEDSKQETAENGYYKYTAESALGALREDTAPIFTTDIAKDELWSLFLVNLPPTLRNKFSCYTCRHFMSNCGHLVKIDEKGTVTPLLWGRDCVDDNVPAHLRMAIRAVRARVRSANVNGEFQVKHKTQHQGAMCKGGYKHFYLDFPDARLAKPQLAGFAVASTSEKVTMLRRILQDHSLETVRTAATMLTEHKLSGPDHHKAAVRWLLEIREGGFLEEKTADRTARHNLIYLRAATAFTGCLNQLRSGALATLLENITAGKGFDVIRGQWSAVVHPLQYQRPQAAPSVGQINTAERLMETLGVNAYDLRRRQLAMSEIPEQVILWKTRQTRQTPSRAVKPGGLFSNIETKNTSKPASTVLEMPATRITFTKLVHDVLPKAHKLEYKLADRDGIFFCITGYEGTVPIMQWHREDNRASWFVYHNPAPVKQHNLIPKAWNEISCLIPFPHLWDGVPHTTTFPLAKDDSTDFKHYHKNNGFRYLLCLKGVTLDEKGSLCLFPSLLKSEYRGIRTTIEAYSNKGKLAKEADLVEKGGLVAGIAVARSAMDMKHFLRVTDEHGMMGIYELVLFE